MRLQEGWARTPTPTCAKSALATQAKPRWVLRRLPESADLCPGLSISLPLS